MFYTIKVFCQNCKMAKEQEIPKGTLVKDYDCPNCGCKTLDIIDNQNKGLSKTQIELLSLIKQVNINGKTLREIGEFVGIKNSPQLIKHHLNQLVEKSLIIWDIKERKISPTEKGLLSP